MYNAILYIIRFICVIAYAYMCAMLFEINILPLIDIYGGWTWLGLNFMFMLGGTFATFAFITTYHTSSSRQATRKPYTQTIALSPEHIINPSKDNHHD
jgi:hypothetical protein